MDRNDFGVAGQGWEMMMHTFTDALTLVLKEEGGWVNNPADPGGMTNLGVTARTWASWSGEPASEATMRALTPEQVTPLYKADYWDKIAGDQMPAAMALPVFDFAVNAGPGRSARILQGLVGVAQDGAIGPGTLGALQAHIASDGLESVITDFSNARADYYRALSTFPTFGRGWLARVDRIETAAIAWADNP